MKAGKTYTVVELAAYASVLLHGNTNNVICNISTLDKAKVGDLSFYASVHYKAHLSTTNASAVILEQKDVKYLDTNPHKNNIACLVTNNPRLAMAKIAGLFAQNNKAVQQQSGIHTTAVIGNNTIIDKTAYIAANVVLGNNVYIAAGVTIGAGSIIMDGANIGENAILETRVTIHERVQLGARVFIHSGAVVGSEGFGFAIDNGAWVRIPHLGSVIIGSDCEIGANTTIDRGVIDDTVLENGVIIDNLVQIGHNVYIGAHTAIAGCVAIAGSTKIGKYCLIGGGSSIAGHLEIADHVHITATSGVNRSLHRAGSYSSGFPVQTSDKWRRNAGRFQFLDQLATKVKALENKLKHKKNKESLIS